MHRINSSRQTLSAKQCNANYRPSGAIAAHVLASTIEIKDATFQVRGATLTSPMHIGKLELAAQTHVWFVASKFDGRYYLVTDDGQCSSPDERTCGMCAAKLETHLNKARKLQAA